MITDKDQVCISIFGLGYVGAVSAACFAQNGYRVIGVDVQQQKIELINLGKSPIVERGVEEIISRQVKAKRLSATNNSEAAVFESDLSIICVGTPSGQNGEIDFNHIETVVKEIGEALKVKEKYHVIVIRSTVPPGTTRNKIIPIIEKASGKSVGKDFGICFNPEFLREASAVEDFNYPPKTIIGEFDRKSGEIVASLYKDLPAVIFRTTIETAEMLKYADNAWHALKISYANEIGSICKAVGVDSHELMNIFCRDIKLNISPLYLKPGFVIGGSCLPKDLRAIISMGRKLKLEIPLLESILPSNQVHLERALQIIRNLGVKKVGILGVTFKAGTDDMRESPSVKLVEVLLKEGFNVSIYDESIVLSGLRGENQRFLFNHIPDFLNLFKDTAKDFSKTADVFVVTQNTLAYRNVIKNRRKGQIVIDLVHLEGYKELEDYYILC
ncbi:MAG: UDP-glucose/GDP-mannose dehydrogenase family protein [Actinobacteria bacterium]|nr:UDP-glucose/GDP-mannose dehydrogenase family protein [Actinomycetota bacterium]